MNQSVVIRCLILFILVQQVTAGAWYSFELKSGENVYATDADFKLDEIDSEFGGNSYNSFDELDDKMEMHELFADLCLWISLFILGTALTGASSQIRNAEKACFILALISLINGIMFVTFPYVLEDDAKFFSSTTGVNEDQIYFWNNYVDGNNVEYDWGPKFAWFSSLIIIVSESPSYDIPL